MRFSFEISEVRIRYNVFFTKCTIQFESFKSVELSEAVMLWKKFSDQRHQKNNSSFCDGIKKKKTLLLLYVVFIADFRYKIKRKERASHATTE